MGISVEGQKCPVCGAYIFDNDDLVFCPECGAPHHRDCYEALGHCAYQDKHGTDEGYNPEAEKEKANASGSLFGDEPPFEENKNTVPCRFCGEPLSIGERVCHNCGRPQMSGPAGASPFGTAAAFTFDPLGGVAPDEMIGEVTAKEIKEFVVANPQRYVPRFRGIKKEKRGSWNWAAFFIPETWFFYRKMYLPGILVAIFTIISSLFLFPFQDYLATIPEEATASYMTLMGHITENADYIFKQPFFYLAMASVVISIAIRVVCGLMGDKIYFKAVTEGIKSVKESENELDLPLEAALARKGGVNPLLGLICLFGFDIVVSLVQLIYISIV